MFWCKSIAIKLVMVGSIFTQHGEYFLCAVIHFQSLVALNHSGKRVVTGIGFGIVLDYPASAFNGGEVSATPQVVISNV